MEGANRPEQFLEPRSAKVLIQVDVAKSKWFLVRNPRRLEAWEVAQPLSADYPRNPLRNLPARVQVALMLAGFSVAMRWQMP